MCNNTQKKKAAGAGKDFTLFFGVMLHFNFKCVETSLENLWIIGLEGLTYDCKSWFVTYLLWT